MARVSGQVHVPPLVAPGPRSPHYGHAPRATRSFLLFDLNDDDDDDDDDDLCRCSRLAAIVLRRCPSRSSSSPSQGNAHTQAISASRSSVTVSNRLQLRFPSAARLSSALPPLATCSPQPHGLRELWLSSRQKQGTRRVIAIAILIVVRPSGSVLPLELE
ncbi:uncharacterized protein FIBRA_06575 [Fibroporia radiculosa]|uniref:Uncharacterized protein n=1 Tax=Fibroporia radiculosa TaxID=599839 RepID=J4H454_9APHY|nr:uncharacterized protein FIBRA_06575 [Fibroporia radiculosa]CCM04399.1 predicted protein [Fibroporia radiculosa]